MKKQILLCPGPVMVSQKVKNATLHSDICHRVPAFEKVIENIRRNIKQIVKADEDFNVVLFTGSGTAANESVISSYLDREKETLLISNGEFGERLEEILNVYEIPTSILKYKWGSLPDVGQIEAFLQKNKQISTIVMVFHETSTGMINPVQEVGKLSNKYEKTYIIDGVSAVGGEDVNVVRDHIDFCTTSSNKCISSLPGVGIICARLSKVYELMHKKPKNVYLNLYKQWFMQEMHHQTSNTPSTTMFYALDSAVQELLEEGLEMRMERYRRCSNILRDGLTKIGMNMIINKENASNTVTTVALQNDIPVKEFINKMEELGFTLYEGKKHLLKENVFQVATMGAIDENICKVFISTINKTLKNL